MIAWKITFILFSLAFFGALRLSYKPLLRFLSVIGGLIMAFRPTDIGSDTENYILIYEWISKTEWWDLYLLPYEWGYVYFMKLLSYCINDFRVVLLFIWTFVYSLAYQSNKKNVFIPLVFSTLCILGVNGYRQFMAITIFCLLYDRNIVLSRVLSVSFHLSAIVLLFVKRRRNYLLVSILGICALAYFIFNYSFQFSIMAFLSSLIVISLPLLVKRTPSLFDILSSLSLFYLLSGPKIVLRLALYVWVIIFIEWVNKKSALEIHYYSIIIFIVTVCPILFLTNL